jgi:hypothetical protein
MLQTHLVVNAEGLVRVLNELMNGESGVVGLNNGVGDLGRGHDGEGSHHAVGELLADLGDQQSAHTGTGTTTEGVGDLEALEAVAALGLTTDDIDDLVDQLGTLGVMTLGPVVASAGLAKDEVVGTEELTKGTGTDGVHGARLEIDEDGTGNILLAGCLGDKMCVSGRMPTNKTDILVLRTSLKYTFIRSSWRSEEPAYLTEVRNGGCCVPQGSVYLHAGSIETMLTRDGLPKSTVSKHDHNKTINSDIC